MNGSMTKQFALTLFSIDPEFIGRAVDAGVAEIIVDWEFRDKHRRQAEADTEINHDTVEDLRRVRACTRARVLCRINGFGEETPREIDEAIAAGADEILLPMARTVAEVEGALALTAGRCGMGIVLETNGAVACAAELASLPLSRVYVGLNDLAIERRTRNIFTAVRDGTVGEIRRHFQVPFGFAGLTLPELGCPIPCRLLIAELVRLECHFSFMRRSFRRDIQGRDMAAEVPRILESIRLTEGRTAAEMACDRRQLEEAIDAWPEPRPCAL
jgi:hypothetical protein